MPGLRGYRHPGYDRTSRTLAWERELLDTLKACDVATFEELVNYGHTELNKFNHRSPLMAAVQMGGHRIVELLLIAGSERTNINVRVNGRTPLMLACIKGDQEMCRILLRYGADVNVIRNDTNKPVTPLYLAASQGHYEISELLLDHGAMLFESAKNWQDSTIIAAIHRKGFTILELFLDYCNKKNLQIPLEILFNTALQRDSEECAIIVLHQGYYPMQEPHVSESGISCFQKAANCGFVKVMSMLLELNPQHGQEKWLVQNDIPVGLAQHSQFVFWLVECRKQAASLQNLCKSVILSQLNVYYIPKIDELPLPNALKKFLKDMKSAYTCNIGGELATMLGYIYM